ncbi:uncharacterized protein BDV14DRAFT_203990 [Aspergillus stella-maris]|uniref:uncharacterized protein n=1 Tax=Aspergillus stella-maris TaxID=1810926 RepID=UPI003CCDA974
MASSNSSSPPSSAPADAPWPHTHPSRQGLISYSPSPSPEGDSLAPPSDNANYKSKGSWLGENKGYARWEPGRPHPGLIPRRPSLEGEGPPLPPSSAPAERPSEVLVSEDRKDEGLSKFKKPAPGDPFLPIPLPPLAPPLGNEERRWLGPRRRKARVRVQDDKSPYTEPLGRPDMFAKRPAVAKDDGNDGPTMIPFGDEDKLGPATESSAVSENNDYGGKTREEFLADQFLEDLAIELEPKIGVRYYLG